MDPLRYLKVKYIGENNDATIVKVKPDTNIGSVIPLLQSRINSIRCITVNNLRLLHKGNRLRLDVTFEECGVQNNDVIDVLPERVGQGHQSPFYYNIGKNRAAFKVNITIYAQVSFTAFSSLAFHIDRACDNGTWVGVDGTLTKEDVNMYIWHADGLVSPGKYRAVINPVFLSGITDRRNAHFLKSVDLFFHDFYVTMNEKRFIVNRENIGSVVAMDVSAHVDPLAFLMEYIKENVYAGVKQLKHGEVDIEDEEDLRALENNAILTML